MDLYTEVKRLLNDNTPPLKAQERETHIEEVMQRMNNPKELSDTHYQSLSSAGTNCPNLKEEI